MYNECLELLLDALHEYLGEVDAGSSMTPLHEAYCYLFDFVYPDPAK